MNPIILKYLPIALLVRSRDAQWTLPSSSLPSGLPTDFDRNGLFQVAPADAQFVHTTHAHIEVAPGITKIAKRKLHVKRHQLPLVCAQVKTIHVAQGGGWPAVIADVRRPPRVQKTQHWLITYVAFSRAETLDGLLLLRLCSREDLEVGAPQYLLQEIDRLLALEKHSFDKLRTHIKNPRCKVPQFILDLFSDACGSKPDTSAMQDDLQQGSGSTGNDENKRAAGNIAGADATAPAATHDDQTQSNFKHATEEAANTQQTTHPSSSHGNNASPANDRDVPRRPVTLPHDPSADMLNAHLLLSPAVAASETLGYTQLSQASASKARRGLQNLGNTCWGNALLFALHALQPVRSWCNEHASNGACSRAAVGSFCPLCSLAADFVTMCSPPQQRPVQPITITARSAWNASFDDTRQHDAHEAFITLLDACNSADHTLLADILGVNEANAVAHTLPMWQHFGFITKTHTYCPSCLHSTYQHEARNFLQLPVRNSEKSVRTLIDDMLIPTQVFDKEDRCTVPGCRRTRRRLQQLHLCTWPRILVVHLMRFSFNRKTGRFNKLKSHVPFSTSDTFGGNTPYDLQAVVVHTGNFAGGHYTTFTKTTENTWLFCDDATSPYPVPEEQATRASAYLLFYEKRCL